jgi:hypothetical protein
LQFIDLLFYLNDDTPDFIETGANSSDHLLGGLILMPQPLQLRQRSYPFMLRLLLG